MLVKFLGQVLNENFLKTCISWMLRSFNFAHAHLAIVRSYGSEAKRVDSFVADQLDVGVELGDPLHFRYWQTRLLTHSLQKQRSPTPVTNRKFPTAPVLSVRAHRVPRCFEYGVNMNEGKFLTIWSLINGVDKYAVPDSSPLTRRRNRNFNKIKITFCADCYDIGQWPLDRPSKGDTNWNDFRKLSRNSLSEEYEQLRVEQQLYACCASDTYITSGGILQVVRNAGFEYDDE